MCSASASSGVANWRLSPPTRKGMGRLTGCDCRESTEERQVVETKDQAALPDPDSFQGIGCSGTSGTDQWPHRARRCVSADQYLQDQRLPHIEDAGASG